MPLGQHDTDDALPTDDTSIPDGTVLVEALTDEELTALALATEPGGPPADDAVPLAVHVGAGAGLLPEWYMPAPRARPGRSRWRTAAVLAVVALFLVLEALGLCSAFGHVVVG